jgi:hypothetical protein
MFALFDSAQEDWYLPRWKERYEVMQYTGLRDKNGKEIYEGDIAQHRIKGIRTVVFRDGAFRTKRLKPVAGESEDAFFFYECTGKDWEVIGSIYENPELLQGGEIKCT